jgi:hypothetical protein
MKNETRYAAIMKENRQWLRVHRLDHARYQLSLAQNDEDRGLWRKVIAANMLSALGEKFAHAHLWP